MKGPIFSIASVLIAITVLFSLYPKVYAGEGQVEFRCDADTYTDKLDPLSNYGGVYYLYIANNPYAIQMVWLKFNFSLYSRVPDGAVVDNATVKVFPTIVTVTHEISAYYCSNNSWEELTINYFNQPLKAFGNSSILDTTLVGSPNQWYSWNVTSAMKRALDNGSNTLTIVLAQDNWDLSLKQLGIVQKPYGFRSSLYVHWTDVVPEFSTWASMLGLFIMVTLIMVIVNRRIPARQKSRSF